MKKEEEKNYSLLIFYKKNNMERGGKINRDMDLRQWQQQPLL